MLKALMTEFFSYGVSAPTLSKEVFELWNKKKSSFHKCRKKCNLWKE